MVSNGSTVRYTKSLLHVRGLEVNEAGESISPCSSCEIVGTVPPTLPGSARVEPAVSRAYANANAEKRMLNVAFRVPY